MNDKLTHLDHQGHAAYGGVSGKRKRLNRTATARAVLLMQAIELSVKIVEGRVTQGDVLATAPYCDGIKPAKKTSGR